MTLPGRHDGYVGAMPCPACFTWKRLAWCVAHRAYYVPCCNRKHFSRLTLHLMMADAEAGHAVRDPH